MKKRRIMIDVATGDDITIKDLVDYAIRIVNSSSMSHAVLAIEVRELRK